MARFRKEKLGERSPIGALLSLILARALLVYSGAVAFRHDCQRAAKVSLQFGDDVIIHLELAKMTNILVAGQLFRKAPAATSLGICMRKTEKNTRLQRLDYVYPLSIFLWFVSFLFIVLFFDV